MLLRGMGEGMNEGMNEGMKEGMRYGSREAFFPTSMVTKRGI
jgi:flagellar biosynthesis/type III secretory pathway protein FliH